MTKHVLIIDDSLEIQILLRVLLEAKGYQIDCTSNGEEALRLLQHSDDLPDLILLDLQMPIMDGESFLKRQHDNFRLKNIPVVIMSGDDDVRDKGRCIYATDVLPKPFDILSIVNAVERNSRVH